MWNKSLHRLSVFYQNPLKAAWAETGSRGHVTGPMRQHTRNLSALALLIFMAAAAGCGTSERELALAKSIGEARVALDVARTSDTLEHAEAELSIAEEKLTEARTALNQDEYGLASRRLAEAEVNLVLARAKADAARARAKADAARKPGNQGPAPPGATPEPR